MNTQSFIPCIPVPDELRLDVTAELFGVNFPLKFEPFVYGMASQLSADYDGGYWHFYSLTTSGFYMAPSSDTPYRVSCENGFEGSISAEAFGIVCCMYAYSHLSFGDGEFAETCAEQYHLLREFMFEHAEVASILRAID